MAALLLLLLAPLMLALASLVRRDGGSAFFRHQRMGFGGQPFYCLKFRSMHVDAQRLLNELLKTMRKLHRNGHLHENCAMIRA